jgi:hypothetical protein
MQRRGPKPRLTNCAGDAQQQFTAMLCDQFFRELIVITHYRPSFDAVYSEVLTATLNTQQIKWSCFNKYVTLFAYPAVKWCTSPIRSKLVS